MFSVFYSKLLYLVGHSFSFFIVPLMLLRGKKPKVMLFHNKRKSSVVEYLFQL